MFCFASQSSFGSYLHLIDANSGADCPAVGADGFLDCSWSSKFLPQTKTQGISRWSPVLPIPRLKSKSNSLGSNVLGFSHQGRAHYSTFFSIKSNWSLLVPKMLMQDLLAFHLPSVLYLLFPNSPLQKRLWAKRTILRSCSGQKIVSGMMSLHYWPEIGGLSHAGQCFSVRAERENATQRRFKFHPLSMEFEKIPGSVRFASLTSGVTMLNFGLPRFSGRDREISFQKLPQGPF